MQDNLGKGRVMEQHQEISPGSPLSGRITFNPVYQYRKYPSEKDSQEVHRHG
jgi:hypothetical protein